MKDERQRITGQVVYKFRFLPLAAGLIPFVPLVKAARESIRFKSPDMGILAFGLAAGEATFVGLAILLLIDPSIGVSTAHGLVALLSLLRLGMAADMNFSYKEVSNTPNSL